MTLDALHHELGNRLRMCKCECIRDYDMKVKVKCGRCKGCEKYDLAVARNSIVQTPAVAAEMSRKAGEQ